MHLWNGANATPPPHGSRSPRLRHPRAGAAFLSAAALCALTRSRHSVPILSVIAGDCGSLARKLGRSGAVWRVAECPCRPPLGHMDDNGIPDDPLYFGVCNPGDVIHSETLAIVSSCRALSSKVSRSVPGGNRQARSRFLRASISSRSSSEVVCLKRRRFNMCYSL